MPNAPKHPATALDLARRYERAARQLRKYPYDRVYTYGRIHYSVGDNVTRSTYIEGPNARHAQPAPAAPVSESISQHMAKKARRKKGRTPPRTASGRFRKRKGAARKKTARKKSARKSPRKAARKSTSKRRMIKVRSQTGSSNRAADKRRSALKPGRRVSRTGRTYTERRANRSDRGGWL